MFYSPDDEEQDFLPSSRGGSKLASLFGMDKASSEGGNESLKYTAPRDPKKSKKEPSRPSSVVLHAVALHAFKFVDGKYASQGKLSAAIIGNHQASEYKLLLYLSKQQHVTDARITPSFKLIVQPNNYASFYDDTRQSWSLRFDTEKDLVEFAKQIAITKANNAGSGLDTVICQNLVPGEGGALETGDSVEIKYTGWLFKDNAQGPLFDSNTSADKLLRFRLGKGKVIKGWEEGLIGQKKGNKSFLIVPPQLAYGAEGKGSQVPPNSTLIFEIEVIRVKLAKEKDSPQTSGRVSPVMTSNSEADPVKETADDANSQTAKSDKAKLISRIAKMGQPMLPVTVSGSVASGQYDSDGEVQASPTAAVPTSPKPEIAAKPVLPSAGHPTMHAMNHTQPAMPQAAPSPIQQYFPTTVHGGVPGVSQVALYQSPVQIPMHQPVQTYPGTTIPLPMMQPQPAPPQFTSLYPQQPFAGAPTSVSSDVGTSVMMSESRQQNTEIRLSLSHIGDKIDRLAEKVDQQLSTPGSGTLSVSSNLPNMETSIILHNIQRIVQENERLKRDIFDKSSHIESQNEKIADLLQRNQSYVEQSHVLLEQRNDQYKATATHSQALVLSLEQEKVKLTSELSSATSQVSALQLELTALRKKESELRQHVDSVLNSSQHSKDELELLRLSQTEKDTQIEELTQDLKRERLTRKQLDTQLSEIQEERTELSSAKRALEKALADKKRKLSEETQRLEEEIDEIKQQHESVISTLKEKLRKQKTSTDAVTAEQISLVEEDLNRDWKEKCDRLLAVSQEKHQRALRNIEDEKKQLEENILTLEEKMASMKTSKKKKVPTATLR